MRIVFIVVLTLTLAACNTFHGVGRDISAAGDGIADAAK